MRRALGVGTELPLAMNVVVIDTGAHRVLVDGGTGPHFPASGRLRDGVRRAVRAGRRDAAAVA